MVVLLVGKLKRGLSWVAKLFKTNFQKWSFLYSLWRVSLLERKNGPIHFSLSNSKPSIMLGKFEKLFSKRTSRNIEALSWKHIKSNNRCSEKILSYSLNSCHQIRLCIITFVALINWFFSWTLKWNLEKLYWRDTK